MQQPDHLKSFQTAQQATPRRFVSFGFVVLFHVFVIYAFASGLANHLVEKLPVDIITKVEPPKLPDIKPPPPPPPDLAKPPPPYVPPPDIVIQQEASNSNAITVQHTQQVDGASAEAERHNRAGVDHGWQGELRRQLLSADRRAPESGRHCDADLHIGADGSRAKRGRHQFERP